MFGDDVCFLLCGNDRPSTGNRAVTLSASFVPAVCHRFESISNGDETGIALQYCMTVAIYTSIPRSTGTS